LAGSLVSSSFALSVSWAPQHLYGPHFQIWCDLPSSRPKWTFPFPYSKYRSYSKPIHPSTGFIIYTSYMAVRCHELFILYKKNKKKLRFKNIISFYKFISKSFEFGYNTWSKNNINNNIKLVWSKFKWVWLQH
jgi:hypothetical protein